MIKLKNRYIYIVLLSMLALVLLYSAYALIVDGSPTLKSLREHVKSANVFHKDSLYDKAIEPYRRAIDMNPESPLANYNSATNLILKNHKDLKDEIAEPEVVTDVFSRALTQSGIAAAYETVNDKVAQICHNRALVYHYIDTLEAAAESYKESLRKNPNDDETRYNLAVVLYQLKNKQNQEQQEQQNQEQQQQQNQEQQQQQQNQEQQQSQEQQQQENQAQQQQSEEELSKENAERLLDAVMQDEKGVLEKVKRERNRTQKQKLQKNW